MAKNKKNNKVTAGDLFGKMGKNGGQKKGGRSPDEELYEELGLNEDEIDLTDSSEDSDSDLDLNEVLQKYLPQYSDILSDDGDKPKKKNGGVLSALKNAGEDDKSDYEQLIDSLDSAFGIPDSKPKKSDSGKVPAKNPEKADTIELDATDEEEPAQPVKEDGDEPQKPAKNGRNSLLESLKASADEIISEYELDDEEYSDLPEDDTADAEESVPDKSYLDESDEQEEFFDGSADEIPEEPAQQSQPKKPATLEDLNLTSLDEDVPRQPEEVELGDTELMSELDDMYEDAHYDEDYKSPGEEGYVEEESDVSDEADGDEEIEELPQTNKVKGKKDKKEKKKFSLFGRKKKDEDDEIIQPDDFEETEAGDGDETVDAETKELAEQYLRNIDEALQNGRPKSGMDSLFKADDGSVVPENTAQTKDVEPADEDEEEEEDEIDPTDINLMVAFGLDAGGNKKAKEFGDKLEAKQQVHETNKVKLDRAEYVDKSQTPKIKKEFHDKRIALWIKLGVCAIFTVLLMIYENIPAFTKLFTGSEKQFSGTFDPAVYPTVYIMVSLQLMLLACFCAVEEIISGFKNLFRGSPKPESMTALLTVAGIVYSIAMTQLTVTPNAPVMFNFVTALSALLTLIYALYNNKREMMNFAIIANKKPKHIVRRLPDEESEGESRAFADNDDVCDVMKIEKTDFIDGFFGRLTKPDKSTGIFMTFAMSVSVAIGVLFGIFANLKGNDGATVCRVIYSAMLFIAPLSAYVTFSYPFYRANVAAKEYDSAIIGETSLEEYSNASIISFDDKNVFPSYSVKVQNIRIYNNARIDRIFYYASSVFAYAGGPLQDVFEVATKDMGISSNVKIYDTEAGFLATQVDGVNIIFGSAAVLQRRGLEIPEKALKDDIDLSDELSIMYMFRENKLVAKMYIKYVMDSDIDLILKQFSGSGLYVCVRTFDPNINEKMIAKKAGMKKMPLKIVRYSNTEEVGLYEEKVDSGLVTCGSPKSLLQIISYCGKVLHTKKTDVALGVLSVMIGLAILVLLLLADSMTTLTSLIIVIYQLIWLVPITVASRVFIR